MPNVTRGDRPGGLMTYLAGPGRANEHTDPHLVAGDPAMLAWHSDAELNRDAALHIARHLDAPRRVFDVDVPGGHIWHCSLSLRAEEGQLTDERWAAITTEFVDRMGFGDEDGTKAACRWVAVRHGLSKNGNDHVHLVVNLVREDGTKASIFNDYSRAQTAARDIEVAHGLQPLESAQRGRASRGYKPGEREADGRRKARAAYNAGSPSVPWQDLPADQRGERITAATPAGQPRHDLARRVRACAAASADEAEFVRRLRGQGVWARPRFAAGRDDVVTGYSVAARPPSGEQPVWYGGGHLARDLALPRLRTSWPDNPQAAQAAVAEWTAAGRGRKPVAPGRETRAVDPALWQQCERDLAGWREQLRSVPIDDRDTWAAVARDTAGAFAAWSYQVETEPGPLAATADALARSAESKSAPVQPRPAGQVGAYGAAMLLASATSTGHGLAQQAMLLRQLANLAKAVHDMHKADTDARRAAQIAASVRGQLATVAARLPDPGPSTAAAGGDAEVSDAVRRARQGQTPMSSPVPNRLATTRAPSTSRPGGPGRSKPDQTPER